MSPPALIRPERGEAQPSTTPGPPSPPFKTRQKASPQHLPMALPATATLNQKTFNKLGPARQGRKPYLLHIRLPRSWKPGLIYTLLFPPISLGWFRRLTKPGCNRGFAKLECEAPPPPLPSAHDKEPRDYLVGFAVSQDVANRPIPASSNCAPQKKPGVEPATEVSTPEAGSAGGVFWGPVTAKPGTNPVQQSDYVAPRARRRKHTTRASSGFWPSDMQSKFQKQAKGGGGKARKNKHPNVKIAITSS